MLQNAVDGMLSCLIIIIPLSDNTILNQMNTIIS